MRNQTIAEGVIADLGSILAAKFFYNPITQRVSAEMKPLWEDICGRYDKGEFRYLNVEHPLNFLSRNILPCTPLQAHLLEFNCGYKRV